MPLLWYNLFRKEVILLATSIIPNPNSNAAPAPSDFSIHSINHIGEINDGFVVSIMQIVGSLNPLPNVIRINISSGGGSIRSGITAYNYLKQLPCIVHTHNLGEVSSAAILPFLAGNVRTADDISKFLFHPATFALHETISYPRLKELSSIFDGEVHDYARIVKQVIPLFCTEHDIMALLTHDTFLVTPSYGYECGLLTPTGS